MKRFCEPAFWNDANDSISLVSSERGAILVVFALLLLPIIAFLALAIDSARLATSQTQQGNTADFVALRMQEAFVASSSISTDYEVRLEASFVQAEQVAARLENSLVVERGMGQLPTGGGPYFIDGSGRLSARDATAITEPYGTITPGRWWFEEPAVGCAAFVGGTADCPCPAGAWAGQCFQPNGTTEDDATAFQVDMHRRVSAPIQTVFAKVLGHTGADIRTRVWVTMIPRLIAFVVDLSKSMVYQTHYGPREARAWGQGHRTANGTTFTDAELGWGRRGEREYAYPLDASDAASRCTGLADFTNKCLDPSAFQCKFHPLSFFSTRWNVDSVGQQNPSGAVNLHTRAQAMADPLEQPHYPDGYHCSLHFKDEYQCICVDIDEDGNCTASDEHYLVDTDAMIGTTRTPHECTNQSDFTQPFAGVSYRGAEPLTTVLSGINRALDIMEDRLINGDGVGVIFIDHDTIPMRMFPRPGGPASLARVGDANFETLKRITNTDTSDPNYRDNLRERLQSFVFPRYRPSFNPVSGLPMLRGADTNIINGLAQAYRMLIQDSIDSLGNRMIALFSDGLGTCSHNPPAGFDPDVGTDFLDFDTAGLVPILPIECVVPAADAYNNHLIAVRQAVHFLTGAVPNYRLPTGFQSLQEQNISFNMFLVGDAVRPHTVVRKGNGGCMTDSGARAGDWDYTMSEPDDATAHNQFDGRAVPGNVYLQPNSIFYDAVVATSGLWAPIRPPCQFTQAGYDSCSDGGMVAWMNDQCDSSGGSVGDPVSMSWTGGGTETWYGQPGMLACDPNCLDQNQQVQRKIEELFSNNPFVLIEAPA